MFSLRLYCVERRIDNVNRRRRLPCHPKGDKFVGLD